MPDDDNAVATQGSEDEGVVNPEVLTFWEVLQVSGLLWLLVPGLFVALFVHEAGHAYTTKAFGRSVNRAGYPRIIGPPSLHSAI